MNLKKVEELIAFYEARWSSLYSRWFNEQNWGREHVDIKLELEECESILESLRKKRDEVFEKGLQELGGKL